MLHLAPITKYNWIDAISLKVRDDQKQFVASNAVSLAQLNFLDNFLAQGIFHDETMVGFTLYGIDEEDGEFWIYRIMIDEKQQGKGYGRQAVQLVIDDIEKRKAEGQHGISLSYEPENHVAKRLYESIGFREEEGLIIEGEQVARYLF